MEVSITEEKIFYLKIMLQRLYRLHLEATDPDLKQDLEYNIQGVKNEIAKERSKLNGT